MRPRSAVAHRKVLEAAAELFAERGMDATSMDAIAEAAGASKATIYKHWGDKDALCLAVLAHLHGLDEERPAFNSGDFRRDLIAQLSYEPGVERKAMREKLWPHLVAYSARNPAFGTAWRAKVMEPAKKCLSETISHGERLGVLNMRGVHRETALAILLGPMIYRHVFLKGKGARLTDLETHVADVFLSAFSAAPIRKTKVRKLRKAQRL